MMRIFTTLSAATLLIGAGCKHVGGACDCGPQPGEATTYPAGGLIPGRMVQGPVSNSMIVSTGPGVPGGSVTTAPPTTIGTPMPLSNTIAPASVFEPLPTPPKPLPDGR